MRFAAWFGFGFLVCAPAFAAEPALVIRLRLESCLGVDAAEVERVLAAELGAHLGASGAEVVTEVTARCSGARLVLEVSDPISRKTLRRSFEWSSALGPGRSRLVGIAASELVLASWAELELNPTPKVEPEGQPASPAAALAARDRLRRRVPPAPVARELGPSTVDVEPSGEVITPGERWFQARKPEDRRLRTLGLVSMRRFLNRDGTLWGGGVRVGQEPLVATSWAADTIYETGSIQDRSGRSFDIDTWTLGAQLLLAGQLDPVTLRAGIGLRAGIVFSALNGEDSFRDSAVAPWGWPFLALSATLTARRFVLDLTGEGGYVALPVSQSTATATVFRGVWVSAQVGVGIIP